MAKQHDCLVKGCTSGMKREIHQKVCSSCFKNKKTADPTLLAAAIANGTYSTTTTTATANPPVKVLAEEINEISGKFEIKIEVKTSICGTSVKMVKGTKRLHTKTTDAATGMAIFTHTEPQSEAGKSIDYRFVNDKGEEAKHTVELPAAAAPPPNATIAVSGVEVNRVGTNFEIKIEVKTSKPSVPVRMIKGITTLSGHRTDALAGEHIFTHTEPQTEAGKTIELRFVTDQGEVATKALDLPINPATPPAPEVSIEIKAFEVKEVGNNFEIKVEVKTSHPNSEVRVKKRMNFLSTFSTDAQGEYIFIHNEPATEKSQIFPLRFNTASGKEETLDVELPAAKKPQTECKPEPVNLRIFATKESDGKWKIFTRVTDECGNGIANVKVKILSNGNSKYITTDAQGNAEYKHANLLTAGTSTEFTAIVSGIEDAARLNIYEPKPAALPTGGFFQRLRTCNNTRAKLAILATMILLVMSFLACLKKPLYQTTVESKEYLQDQQAATTFDFSKAVQGQGTSARFVPALATMNHSKEIGEPKPIDDSGRNFLLWITMFGVFLTSVYSLFAMREEISEAVRESVYRLAEKHNDKVDDPLIERLGKYAGSFASSRKRVTGAKIERTEGAVETTQETPKERGSHPTFWTMFQSDLLSDFMIELLPKLLKKIFRS